MALPLGSHWPLQCPARLVCPCSTQVLVRLSLSTIHHTCCPRWLWEVQKPFLQASVSWHGFLIYQSHLPRHSRLGRTPHCAPDAHVPQAPGESEQGLALTAEWTLVRTLLIMLKIVLIEGMGFVDPLKYRSET